MTKLLIFLLALLVPSSKPCLPREALAKWGLPRDPIACLQSLPSLEPKLKLANFFLRKPEITKAISLIEASRPFLPYLDYFFGQNKPVSYLVLLQNDRELRANGGFFGSYAVVDIDKGNPTFRFQDIYVPDGAIPGHVEPPAPIQTAFKQGWFRLRDADWEPDFPTAATTIRWFLTKGNEVNPDVLLTLNLTTIEKLAKIIGEVEVPEYGFKLNADNLYTLLQNQAEIGAFPGSTQKKDVLSAAGRAVTKKLAALPPQDYLAFAQIVLDNLDHSNLLLNSQNQPIQKVIEDQRWAGRLVVPACQQNNCLNDTVMLVETNLGANKANCCVERKTTHTITKNDTDVSHLVNLTFKNTSPLENPLPPRFYGGNYITYLRFYLPENAKNIRLTAQPTLPKTLLQYPAPFDGITNKTFDLKDNYGLRELGFFHLTAAGTSSQVQLSYDLPRDGDPTTYQLTLLKQHGLESSPQEINLFGKSSSTNFESNYTSVVPIL